MYFHFFPFFPFLLCWYGPLEFKRNPNSHSTNPAGDFFFNEHGTVTSMQGRHEWLWSARYIGLLLLLLCNRASNMCMTRTLLIAVYHPAAV